MGFIASTTAFENKYQTRSFMKQGLSFNVYEFTVA